LHRTRGQGAITWSEIEAYSRLAGTTFSRPELDALRALDNAWIRFQSGRLKAERGSHG
jgi:hypothetical protein